MGIEVRHARENGNQRCGKVWRWHYRECRHKSGREIQVSCQQSVVRHSTGSRPSLEVSPRSEESWTCCGGVNIVCEECCDESYNSFCIMAAWWSDVRSV